MGVTVWTRPGRTEVPERMLEQTATLRPLPENAPAAPRGRTEAMAEDEAAAEFHAFFERHHAELSRLAYLLTGEADAADDLAADAIVAL